MGLVVKEELTGTKQVNAEIGKFTKRVQTKIVRRALMKVSRKAKGDMKNMISKETGLLGRSMGEKLKTYKGSGIVVGIIGPRKQPAVMIARPSPPRWSSNPLRAIPLFYANPLHAGPKAHIIPVPTRGGGLRLVQHPGHAADPFIAMTWRVGQVRYLGTLEQELWQGIFAEWNKP